MEATQFAEGAMRRCFRLLKETQVRRCVTVRGGGSPNLTRRRLRRAPATKAPGISDAYRDDWQHASAYVAKEYKDAAVGTREAYERDCKVREWPH
jgi:hypothetical protein